MALASSTFSIASLFEPKCNIPQFRLSGSEGERISQSCGKISGHIGVAVLAIIAAISGGIILWGADSPGESPESLQSRRRAAISLFAGAGFAVLLALFGIVSEHDILSYCTLKIIASFGVAYWLMRKDSVNDTGEVQRSRQILRYALAGSAGLLTIIVLFVPMFMGLMSKRSFQGINAERDLLIGQGFSEQDAERQLQSYRETERQAKATESISGALNRRYVRSIFDK